MRALPLARQIDSVAPFQRLPAGSLSPIIFRHKSAVFFFDFLEVLGFQVFVKSMHKRIGLVRITGLLVVANTWKRDLSGLIDAAFVSK
jgi:hypothetical protein